MLGSLISKNSEQAVIERVFLYNRRIGGEYKNYLCFFYSFFMQKVHIGDIFNFLNDSIIVMSCAHKCLCQPESL